MNGVSIFCYHDVQVRTQRDANNEPLFCLADICKALGLSNPSMVVSQICEEFGCPKLNLGHLTDALGRDQEASFITEPQLYFVMMRSRSDVARPFRQWVVTDVLPAIRKTGHYETNQTPDLKLKLELAKIMLAPAGIEGNQLTLALDKVYKANTGESLLAQTGVELIAPTQERLLNPTELGKPLGLSPRTVNSRLQAKGFQVKGVAGWELTSTGKALGGVYLDTGKKHSSGVPVRQIKWPATVATEL